MKKLLTLFVALATLLVFTGCDQEATQKVSIEDNNADSQYNYDLVGKTLSFSENNQKIQKVVTTTGVATTNIVSTDVVLSTDSYSLKFTELNDNDQGTFTYSYAETANAAADAAYASSVSGSTATQYLDGLTVVTCDNSGFSGKTLKSETVSGTYEIVTNEEGREIYRLTFTTYTEVITNPNSVPTTTSTYVLTSSATTTTPLDKVLDMKPVVSVSDENDVETMTLNNQYSEEITDYLNTVFTVAIATGDAYTISE